MSATSVVPAPEGNRIDFIPRLTGPFDWGWTNLGTVFKLQNGKRPTLASGVTGRCSFVVREGFDPLDHSSTGRVLESSGDMGLALRSKSISIGLTASSLSMKTGLDDPLATSAAAGTAPSLKATIAQEISPDTFISVSYDLKLKKPEFGLCWTGETFTEKATVSVQADPIQRALSLSAAVSFPGPEWRDTLYDEEKDAIEEPKDTGARHQLWVRHEARHRDALHHTAVGARLDLGRLVNYATNFIDCNIEPRLPPLFWALPGSQLLYNFLIPAENEDQIRHKIQGWDLETSFDFNRKGPRLALSKSLRHSTLTASWDAHDAEAGLEYAQGVVRLGARIGRVGGVGSEGASWRKPSLYIHLEPLALV